MMSRFIYKNQIFYIFIALFFFFYATFYYVQNKRLERLGVLHDQEIVKKYCSVAPRRVSSITVIRGDKSYYVRVKSEECLSFEIGDKVKLYYNEKYDYYYLPGSLKVHSIRLSITGIVLFLVLLPWKLIVSALKR